MIPERILIVGGGIAGLALAGALGRLGKHVDLVEKTGQWRPAGAGLILQQNAISVLDALGLGARITERGCALPSLILADRRGMPLSTSLPLDVGGEMLRTFTIHRAALHAALLEACAGANIRLGTSIGTLEESGDGVEVIFTDASRARYDLVVGADGVHSVVRERLVRPPASDFKPAGYGCWRCVLPNAIGLRYAIEQWGSQKRVGLVPLPDDMIYCFLVISTDKNIPHEMDILPPELRDYFSGFGQQVDAMLSLLHKDSALIWNDLGDLPLNWGRGRVLLIGDAAHAATPNLGQGAAMALEDVACLAEQLATATDWDAAVNAFRRIRTPRVTAIQNQSAAVGRMAHIASPLGRGVRDFLMRRIPRRLVENSATKLILPGVRLAQRLSEACRIKSGGEPRHLV